MTPISRIRTDLALYIGGLVATGFMSVFATERLVWVWAPYAIVGTTVGAVGALLLANRPSERVRLRLAVFVAAMVSVVPLGAQAFRGIGEPELAILEAGAMRWLGTGTPYPSVEALAQASDFHAYNVYFPLLQVSGLPDALFGEGPLSDPRWYLLAASLGVLHVAGVSRTATLRLLAIPPLGFDIAAGMTDLPVVALLCASLALAGRGRTLWAGAATGLAAALKFLAWPAVPILLALVWARNGARAAREFSLAVLGCLAVGLVLPALADPPAFWANTIAHPLGLEPVSLEARSPLPGYLLASTGPAGRDLAILLLGAAAVGMLLWLMKRPPRSMRDAALRLTVGWTLLIGLAPATRIGYLVFPLAVLVWAYAIDAPVRAEPLHSGDRGSRRSRSPSTGPVDRSPGTVCP